MRVRFHRSRHFEVILSSPRASSPRGFFFVLSLGVEAPVDPLSGMTVNLSAVDRWLDELPWPSEAKDVWSLVDLFWACLAPEASRHGARLARLEIRDRVSWWAREGERPREWGFIREQSVPVEGVLRPFKREFVAISDLEPSWIDAMEGRELPPSGWPPGLVEIRQSTLDGRRMISLKQGEQAP